MTPDPHAPSAPAIRPVQTPPGCSAPRAAWRLAGAIGQALAGRRTIRRDFPGWSASERHAATGRWAQAVLARVGIDVAVHGTPAPLGAAQGGCLLLSNHVSWLDVPTLLAAVPHARFVSKSEVHHWPLLGPLVAGAGTLFIERARKRDALRVVHTLAERLAAGDCIAVFPEGTTGFGAEPLPMHANLLQAAAATGTRVQVAVLRYHEPHQPFSARAAYVDDSLLTSAWAVARAGALRADVTLLPPMDVQKGDDRRALAERVRGAMAEVLRAVPVPR